MLLYHITKPNDHTEQSLNSTNQITLHVWLYDTSYHIRKVKQTLLNHSITIHDIVNYQVTYSTITKQ